MQNDIILVIGPKGAGKTHKVTDLIGTMERSAAFDVLREKAYSDREVIVGQPKALYEALSRDRESFKVTYRPTCIDFQDNGLIESAEFEPFVKLCYLRGKMCMIIDEAHLICNGRNCPKMLMVSSLIGRHRELSMILVAQSFSGVHPAIRKNTDQIYFWKIIEPSDLEGIRERCGEDVRDQVRALRATEISPDGVFKSPGQMLHWTKFGGVVEVTK